MRKLRYKGLKSPTHGHRDDEFSTVTSYPFPWIVRSDGDRSVCKDITHWCSTLKKDFFQELSEVCSAALMRLLMDRQHTYCYGYYYFVHWQFYICMCYTLIISTPLPPSYLPYVLSSIHLPPSQFHVLIFSNPKFWLVLLIYPWVKVFLLGHLQFNSSSSSPKKSEFWSPNSHQLPKFLSWRSQAPPHTHPHNTHAKPQDSRVIPEKELKRM